MKIIRGRHSVTSLYAHLVFVAKRRGQVFQGKHLEFLHGVFAGVMVEFEGEVEILFAPDKCGAGNQYPHQIALAVSVSLVEQVFEMGAYGIA